MKKTLLVVVMMALIIGLFAVVASAKSDNGNGQGQGQELLLQPETQEFTDVEGHWAAWAIKKANAKGLMVGMGDNYFGAEEPLTKAQVLVLLDRLTADDDADDDADVKGAPVWAKNSVQKAVYGGLIKRFHSEAQCERAYAFVVLAQELINEGDLPPLPLGYVNPFKDLGEDNPFTGLEEDMDLTQAEIFEYMMRLHAAGIIKGSDGNLNPGGALKRAEAAVLLDQVSVYFDNDSDDDDDDEEEDEEE